MSEPPYDPERPCPKCGNPICASEFRSGGQRWSLQLFDRIVRHCGRCEYRWYELPLDHDPQVETEHYERWLERFREKQT